MNDHADLAAINRALLTKLAREPDQQAPRRWAAPARATARMIRAHLTSAAQHALTSVSFADLHRWRSSLDTALDHLADADPELWQRWCTPGTWLDSLLRLRSLIAHVLGKAYWDNRPAVPYADMDVTRYLWGAR